MRTESARLCIPGILSSRIKSHGVRPPPAWHPSSRQPSPFAFQCSHDAWHGTRHACGRPARALAWVWQHGAGKLACQLACGAAAAAVLQGPSRGGQTKKMLSELERGAVLCDGLNFSNNNPCWAVGGGANRQSAPLLSERGQTQGGRGELSTPTQKTTGGARCCTPRAGGGLLWLPAQGGVRGRAGGGAQGHPLICAGEESEKSFLSRWRERRAGWRG